MTEHGSSHRPDDPGFLRRLRRPEPMPAEPLLSPTEYRLADTLQRAVDDRLEDGLRAIEEQATSLMREVATEIWRTSSRDVRPEQERLVSLLSRDQAIRGLIASSDERFQALAVRTARLEDHIRELTEAGRQTREAMQAASRTIREIADSPTLHSVETVRSQLETVERHIAETFAHIDRREQDLQETILAQVKEHGELIAKETTRIVEAMQGYVQGGAEAVGRLAQRMEEHATLFLSADHDVTERVRGIVEEQTAELTGELTQQLELVSEKVGLHGRNHEALRAHVERLIEARVMGLAQLIRADSEALRTLIDERDATIREATVQAVSERMDAVARIADERIAELERTIQDQVMLLSSATSASVERTIERMTESLASAASAGADVSVDVEAARAALEERLSAHIDDRVTAIARLIRSDNQVLSRKVDEAAAGPAAGPGAGGGADTEVMRQLLRSVKELQAGLATDVLGSIDRRFQAVSEQLHQESQSQAETMLKVAEMLSERIDRLTAKVDDGMGGDLQIVIDRMSDAIQAMSTVGRRQAS
jgi:hypothetical protein